MSRLEFLEAILLGLLPWQWRRSPAPTGRKVWIEFPVERFREAVDIAARCGVPVHVGKGKLYAGGLR